MKQHEIYWSDLTPEAQARLKELNHENIDNSPLAIIDIEEEVEEIEYEYISTDPLYRNLTRDEVLELRKWAREKLVPYDNPPHPSWHPIVHEEYETMCKELTENNKTE